MYLKYQGRSKIYFGLIKLHRHCLKDLDPTTRIMEFCVVAMLRTKVYKGWFHLQNLKIMPWSYRKNNKLPLTRLLEI